MNRAKYYSLLTIFFLLFTPLHNIGQNIRLEILDIKEINDSLQINYQIWIKQGTVSNRQALHLKPILLVGKYNQPLQSVIMAGKNKQRVLRRWANNYSKQLPAGIINANLKSDSTFHYGIRIPYPERADSAYIFIEQEAIDSRGRHTLTAETVASPIIRANKETYAVLPQVTLIAPKKEDKIQHIEKSDSLFFRIGHSAITSAYSGNRTKLSELEETLRKIIDNKDISLEAIYIHGYASPEGKYKVNETLSSRRALTLKNYIKSKFNIPDSLLRIETTPEDWAGLGTLIEAKQLFTKEEFQNIASINGNDDRETALKRWSNGKPYHIIYKELFPQLRRVKYKICYSIRDGTQSETKALEKNNPENLSHAELYNLALGYGERSPEYKRLLTETIPSYFPDDMVAINNAAAVMIMNGELNQARHILDKGKSNDLLSNNIGVVYLLENNLEEADRYFDKAIASGNKEAIYNKKKLENKK